MNTENHTGETNDSPAGLEWMFQSSRVSDNELTEVLAREYCARIYQLADSIVDNPLIAQQITKDVLAHAVEKRNRYWGQASLTPWILLITVKLAQTWMRKRTWKGKHTPVQVTDVTGAAIPQIPQCQWLFEGLDAKHRLCVVLSCLLDLPVVDITSITGLNEGEVQRILKKVRPNGDSQMKNYLSTRWHYPDPSDDDWTLFLSDVRSQVANRKIYKKKALPLWEVALGAAIFLLIFSIARLTHLDRPEPQTIVIVKVTATPAKNRQNTIFITATPGPSATPYPTPEKSYLYIVRPLESVNEIAGRMGIPVDTIQRINQLDPGKPLFTGQVLVLPVPSFVNGQMIPTPVTPPPGLPALTVDSSQDEILRRIQESSQLWHTLWADVQITLYSPAGQILLVYHKQAWASRPSISMVIEGPAGSGPEILKRTTMIWAGSPDLHQYGVDVYNLRNYQISHFTSNELLDDSDLKNLFFPSSLGLSSGTFENAGTSTLAGREALAWDWYDSHHNRVYRLFVDAKQGILLRLRRFGGHDPENPDFNAVVMNIALDQNFPVDLFDQAFSWPKSFARDYIGNGLMEGERIQNGNLVSVPSALDFLPEIPLPAGYDPSKSFLIFQWSRVQAEDFGFPVKVFADGYYLGKMMSGNPWAITSCKRSDDGRYIGLIEQLRGGIDAPSIFRWYDLKEFTHSLDQPPTLWTMDFAFSPDHRTIANSGCTDIQQGICGVYLWDTVTSSNHLLIQEPFAWKLAWSPDNQYLAMIVMDPKSDRLIIVRTSDGVITYSFQIDPNNPRIPSSSPTNRWAIAYPPKTAGLEDCIFPPNIR